MTTSNYDSKYTALIAKPKSRENSITEQVIMEQEKKVKARDAAVKKVGARYEDFLISKAKVFQEKLNEKAKEL